MVYTIYCKTLLLLPCEKRNGQLCLRPSTWLEALQVEVVFQFFIGYFDHNGAYVDNIVSVVVRYGLSINNFGFDFITSLPWSFLDYWAFQARVIYIYIYIYIYILSLYGFRQKTRFNDILFIIKACILLRVNALYEFKLFLHHDVKEIFGRSIYLTNLCKFKVQSAYLRKYINTAICIRSNS
jgi:hypothetical protein